MRILFWKIGAIGDVVMTTPLVRQVRAACPSDHIDYLVGRAAAAVLAGNPHLSNVIGFDEAILSGPRPHRLASLIRILRRYDLVYVLDKHWIFGLLARLAGIPRRIGFARGREGMMHTARVVYGPLRHEMHYYLDLAAAAGLTPDQDDLRADVPVDPAGVVAGEYAVLCNAGGNNIRERSTVRRLPSRLFGDIVAGVTQRHRVVFVGSAAERALYRAHEGPRTMNLCGELELSRTAAVLRDARAVITTDSGLMHLAGAVNRNVTAVLGPTQPARVCPPGARWVWKDAANYRDDYSLFGIEPPGPFFAGLSADEVLAAAAGL
jgi:ADP-heptose:LPS heptosyltransferase